MKYPSIIFLILSGCAHVSEYNQGCRDGVTRAAEMKGETVGSGGVTDIGRNKDVTEYFCNMLDARRREQEKEGHR